MLGACHRSPVTIDNGYIPFQIKVGKSWSKTSSRKSHPSLHVSTSSENVTLVRETEKLSDEEMTTKLQIPLTERSCVICAQLNCTNNITSVSNQSVPERSDHCLLRNQLWRSMCSSCLENYSKFSDQQYDEIDISCPQKLCLTPEQSKIVHFGGQEKAPRFPFMDSHFQQIFQNNCIKASSFILPDSGTIRTKWELKSNSQLIKITPNIEYLNAPLQNGFEIEPITQDNLEECKLINEPITHNSLLYSASASSGKKPSNYCLCSPQKVISSAWNIDQKNFFHFCSTLLTTVKFFFLALF